ncbi:siderophore-interacting protein [Pseudochelatococcus contaminans]|uniref:NADPH-dependent ferric siderophore reductase n=1 Tax=Pseudochelatococcus contaminans TaxID=1538103 RepID=A0A7W5Z2R6_9HYPH|nr:siderophore-interacting protein [Pseudochelatococcus contaminans]MBB3809007.1 NADPH-dependent ferric siderophore reductase [Pseudochelatococcus contaminans]
MTTTDPDAGVPDSERHRTERVRHPLRIRLLTVKRVHPLTPGMVRITLAGDDLAGFYSGAHDDHVKLFFPRAGEALPVLPKLEEGRVLVDENNRPTARDYTPRHYDASAGELDIDFALHESGPASDWARAAQPGDHLGVAGPRGSFVVRDDFDWYLLVGDETALPAIARRLEELRPEARALVVAEVADADAEQPLSSRADLQVQWLHRDGRTPGDNTLLADAIGKLALPAGDGYVWIACESLTAKRLRDILLATHGHPKAWLKASGYWKKGVANSHDEHAD